MASLCLSELPYPVLLHILLHAAAEASTLAALTTIDRTLFQLRREQAPWKWLVCRRWPGTVELVGVITDYHAYYRSRASEDIAKLPGRLEARHVSSHRRRR